MTAERYLGEVDKKAVLHIEDHKDNIWLSHGMVDDRTLHVYATVSGITLGGKDIREIVDYLITEYNLPYARTK